MKKTMIVTLATVIAVGVSAVYALGPSATYDSIPAGPPPNVVSLGFQATQTAEFGDEIALAGTDRHAISATVLMSSWSLHSDYPLMPAAGYTHSITLNIYTDAVSAQAHAPIRTVTQNFLIPWRPVADPTCPGGTAWRASDSNCYNGFAFPITFNLQPVNYDLPNQFIYGIAYNTQTWGYAPMVVPGPYNSLNVGLNDSPPVAIGTNVDLDEVYWNTMTPFNYTDGGAGGVGTFRADTNWTPYTPAIRFTTATVATSKDSCKNGGWQTLVRSNGTSFKNQGDCVSYTQNGK